MMMVVMMMIIRIRMIINVFSKDSIAMAGIWTMFGSYFDNSPARPQPLINGKSNLYKFFSRRYICYFRYSIIGATTSV